MLRRLAKMLRYLLTLERCAHSITAALSGVRTNSPFFSLRWLLDEAVLAALFEFGFRPNILKKPIADIIILSRDG